MIFNFTAKFLRFLFTSNPLWIIAIIIMVYLINYNYRRRRLVKLIGKIPGLPSLPFIGNSIEINVDHDDLFARLAATSLLWGRKDGFCKGWLGVNPYIFISKASAVEPILGSSKHIQKSREYNFLHGWLGTGLLTSDGSKWFTRRKILTPAFHFRILEDFVDVFREQSNILVEKLSNQCNDEAFNIFPFITHCTLDIICETAMGKKVDAQLQSDSEYVRCVYEIGSIIQARQAKIWLQPECMFRLTSFYEKHKKCIDVLHGFSNQVIKERKLLYRNRKNESKDIDDDTELYGVKKRLAFLDLLIEASDNGNELSDEDIREEVDTFMFEGHDTTSAAISWSLFLLGSHPKVQNRVHSELQSIFGNSDRSFTMKDLNDMKYLECCIKEALRLYPSVPIFARQINQDVVIGKYTVPAGTSAMIIAYQLHRDPEFFPNPEQFNPDNFLPEKIQRRHPYAYIPFSAGPRNCIGQKFALLEEKAVISSVLRKYRIEAIDRREDLTLLGELILRPKHGLKVKLLKRT